MRYEIVSKLADALEVVSDVSGSLAIELRKRSKESHPVWGEIRESLEAKKLIPAVKTHRRVFDSSLSDAKHEVEVFGAREGIEWRW